MKAEDQLELSRCWRRLFLNEDGSLKPDGETVLRDLERLTGWMVSGVPVDNDGATDPYRAVAALQQRGIYASVKRRLFEDLTKVKRKAESNG